MFSQSLATIARILIALVVGRYGLAYQNGLYGLYLQPLCLRIAWNMRTLGVNLRDRVIDGEHGPGELAIPAVAAYQPVPAHTIGGVSRQAGRCNRTEAGRCVHAVGVTANKSAGMATVYDCLNSCVYSCHDVD